MKRFNSAFKRRDLKSSFVLSLFLLGVASYAPMAVAQAPGTFTRTGDLTTARFLHTATLLTNGKVLITGGAGEGYAIPPSSVWSSAELYDPSAGTFTATGSMTTPRAGHTATGQMTTSRYRGHTATLLPGGKVLIAGNSDVASAELYDPSTGIFTATGQMTTAGAHTATLLTNGTVLFVGSPLWGSVGRLTRGGNEIYDPESGTFSLAANRYIQMWSRCRRACLRTARSWLPWQTLPGVLDMSRKCTTPRPKRSLLPVK